MAGNPGIYGLFLVGLAMPACAGFEHDCVETRDCSGPKGFIEAGPNDDWWESGAGAGGELGVGFPLPAAASPSNSGGSAADAGSAAGAAGANDESSSDAGSALNGAPNSVLSVTPADGALGARRDVSIVIRFAQPMNTEATEAAYQSSELPAENLSFSWADDLRTLTLIPHAMLDYAAGAADANGQAVFAAKTYHYGFDGSACDKTGQPLPALAFAFSTLRQVSLALTADPQRTGNWTDGEGEGIHNCQRAAKAPYQPTVCVGDDANNVRYTGFLSFNLSSLPTTISSFSSARLQANAVAYGAPEALGENHLEHVLFEQLGEAALHSAPLAALGPFYSGPSLQNATHLVLSEDLTNAVQDDYANRVAHAEHSSFRLGFSKVAADGSWDDLELPTNGIRLALTYLQP